MEKKTREVRLREVRALNEENAEKMIVEGYAIVFDEPTDLGYIEIIDRNALDECDMSDVCMKYNHEDSTLIMARTRNKSLKLSVDDHGLKIYAELIDTSSNRDLYKSIQAGLLDKMSFSFIVEEAEWQINEGNGEPDVRRITKISKLFDVSVVDVPAYSQTEIFARSKEAVEKEQQYQHELKLEKDKLLLLLEV